jgi:nucleotide-binding universal stress UspA family protein
MYSNILIAIENSDADRTVIEHVQELARLTGASLLLVHVADGWVARNYNELDLRESEEIKEDRAYLKRIQQELTERGFTTRTHLAMGDPRPSSCASPRPSTSISSPCPPTDTGC